MSNDKSNADFEKVIVSMNETAELETANINSRCHEIVIQMESLAEQSALLLAKIEKPRADDRQSRFDKLMSEGMSYEELARYAAEGWSWATYMEDAYDKTIQNQHIEDELGKLSDELEVLAKRRDEVISTFDEVGLSAGHAAEILEERCNANQEKKEIIATAKKKEKEPRAKGGKNRDANTQFPEIRVAVKDAWRNLPNKKHGQKTAFAKAMLLTYPAVTSLETFMRWIREYDEEKSKSDSTS